MHRLDLSEFILDQLLHGNAYQYSVEDIAVAPATPAEFLIQTSKLEAIIYNTEVTAKGDDLTIVGYENPTFSDIGIEVFPVNLNREVNKVSQTKYFADPVLTTLGDRLHGTSAYGSGGQQRKANLASLSGGRIYLLKPETFYLFRISIAAGSANVAVELNHVESNYIQ